MFFRIHYKKIIVVTVILSCLAAIYCIPFIDVQPQIPKRLPQVAYDFSRPPLRASRAKEYKIDKLFAGQFHGAESIEADSWGNLYMAVEGGFILYAQMNTTKPSFTDNNTIKPKLWLLTELNEPKEIETKVGGKNLPEKSKERMCQLDENVYGQQLNSNGHDGSGFHTEVSISRCSKPLGIRLSRNQEYLYVIDTLQGLYKINLRQAHQNLQRSMDNLNIPSPPTTTTTTTTAVSKEKLLDFRINTKKQVPIERMDNEIERHKRTMPIAMTAMDDLVIDHGSGTHGADVIYMTDASQLWLAVNYLFDLMEARPSGLVLRLDTGSNELTVLDNAHLSRVRTGTPAVLISANRRLDGEDAAAAATNGNKNSQDKRILKTRSIPEITTVENGNNNNQPKPIELGKGYGAPRFDSNDIFDDRPLFFPNGIELMDDQQALLIADTSNKRIIKHFIRGPRKGQSDLWTWTPHHPDNIRRGKDPNSETYWSAGCGKDRSEDSLFESLIDEDSLNDWPMMRKFILKNLYFMGWTMEKIGQVLLRSQYIRNFGYSLKMGISLMENLCTGVMLLQYDRHGQLIKSIHGKQFPNDMKLFSQITEVIDPIDKQSHSLYLGSPTYDYVYRLAYRSPS